MKKSIVILSLLFFLSSAFSQKKHDYWKNYISDGKPTIELAYGGSHLSEKNSGIDFNYPANLGYGLIELKLGYSYAYPVKRSPNITHYTNNLIHGSYISSNLRTDEPTSDADPTFRFGFLNASGYGYLLGKKTSLMLYNSNGITWTRYDYGDPVFTAEIPNPEKDNYIRYIEPFNQDIRFGTTTEAGAVIPLGTMLNINVEFDRTLVFPRHLVWKHLGSVIIEAGGQALIDGFVKAILKSSPGAAPVVSFLLKNGLAIGLYELRREKMNWPFNSTEPLLFDTFKAGLNFTF